MKLIIPKIKLLRKIHSFDQSIEKLIVEHIQKALEKDKDTHSFNFKSLRIVKNRVISESVVKDLDILETSILKSKKHIKGNAKKWLSDNNIPPHHQNNILFYLKCRLEDDQDVNLKSVMSVLPHELEWIIKKDLCYDTLKKVPGLQNIDEEWFKSLSSKLKPVIFPKESYIFREGKSLDFLILITNGIAWRYTTSADAGGRVSVSIKSLEKGDFFGEELLQWKLDKRSELESDTIPLSCIPISTADVKSHTQVEAFVLMINDLASCSDFPVDSNRSADLAIERVDRSSPTEEGDSVPLYQMEIELV